MEAELLDNKALPTVDLEAHLSLNNEKTLSIIELIARPKAWDHLITKDWLICDLNLCRVVPINKAKLIKHQILNQLVQHII